MGLGAALTGNLAKKSKMLVRAGSVVEARGGAHRNLAEKSRAVGSGRERC